MLLDRSVQDRPSQLLQLAISLAAAVPDFQEVRGPGAGDRATRAFMEKLRDQACSVFGADFAEKKICGDTSFAADFYFPEEATVVEVALGLPNSATEFEKDILKAIIAQDFGASVKRLVFISRAGACKKCAQPGRRALMAWAKAKHRLDIEVHELGGEPRRRNRRRRHVGAPLISA